MAAFLGFICTFDLPVLVPNAVEPEWLLKWLNIIISDVISLNIKLDRIKKTILYHPDPNILFHKSGSQHSLYIMTLVAWLLLEEMDGNAFSRK